MAKPESLFSAKSTVLAGLLYECLTDKERQSLDPSTDLAQPISLAGGPLSFPRVVGCDASELSYFDGKSFTQAVMGDGVSLDALRVLKDYAKVCMSGPFPRETQQSGELLYYAAIARALTDFDTRISQQPADKLRKVFGLLANLPSLARLYRKLFTAALKRC